MRAVLSCTAATVLTAILCQGAPGSAEQWEMEEMVVREDRARETESLDGEELRETGAADLGEALQEFGGFTKVRKGAIANDLVLRGFQKNDLNVLIDGARVQGACPNRMDPPAFFVDLGETERVDVFKGPFDIRHQGSLGGLVDIRTGSVPEGFRGRANALYGSFNRTDASGRLSYGTEALGFLMGGTYQYAEAYQDGQGRRFTEIYPESSPNRYRPWLRNGKSYLVGDGFARFRLSPSPDHQAEFSYTRHEARDTLYPYLLMDLITDSADLVNAVYRAKDLGEVLTSARVQAYWGQVDHDMTDEKRCSSSENPGACGGSLPEAFSMKTRALTETVGASVEGLVEGFGRTWIGVEYYLASWDAATTLFNAAAGVYRSQASLPDVNTTSIGGYLEHDHRLFEDLTLTAGVRIDHTEQVPGQDRSALYQRYFPDAPGSAGDTYASGNIQLSWAATEELRTFLGFGHTVSVPDASERFIAIERMGTADKPDRVGNPSLAPARNSEVDLAVEMEAGPADLRLDLYYSRVDDFLVVRDLDRSGRIARVARNIDATLYGGEASARVRFPLHIYGKASVACTRGKNETEDTNLAEIPPLQGRVGLGYDDEAFYGLLEGVLTDAQTRVDAFLDEPDTPSWAVANLRLGYRWKWLNAFAGVSNLFDKQYVEHISYSREPFLSGIRVPEPGRTFYVGLRGSF